MGCAPKFIYDVTCMNFHTAFATKLSASEALKVFSIQTNIIRLVQADLFVQAVRYSIRKWKKTIIHVEVYELKEVHK